MKLATMIKSAALAPVLFIGVQGVALAGEPQAMTGSAMNGQQDAAGGMATGKRQHKPVAATGAHGKPSPHPAGSLSAGDPQTQPVGLLLPAVQKVREAAAR